MKRGPKGAGIETISILGTGWLGLPLTAHFAARGYRVKASTRTGNRLPEIQAAGAEPHLVDLGDRGGLPPAFLDADVLIVNIPGREADPFRALVEAVAASGPGRVLFVSTTSVYPDTAGVMTEDAGLENPDSPFLAIEALFRDNPRFQTTVVRFGGLIGYSRQPGRFFTAGRQVRDPQAPVNLIHRDDCLGLIDAIVTQEAWGEVFNACADTHPSKQAFYTYAAESIGLEPPRFAAGGSDTGKIIANDKIKSRLDYVFVHGDLMAIPFG